MYYNKNAYVVYENGLCIQIKISKIIKKNYSYSNKRVKFQLNVLFLFFFFSYTDKTFRAYNKRLIKMMVPLFRFNPF